MSPVDHCGIHRLLLCERCEFDSIHGPGFAFVRKPVPNRTGAGAKLLGGPRPPMARESSSALDTWAAHNDAGSRLQSSLSWCAGISRNLRVPQRTCLVECRAAHKSDRLQNRSATVRRVTSG